MSLFAGLSPNFLSSGPVADLLPRDESSSDAKTTISIQSPAVEPTPVPSGESREVLEGDTSLPKTPELSSQDEKLVDRAPLDDPIPASRMDIPARRDAASSMTKPSVVETPDDTILAPRMDEQRARESEQLRERLKAIRRVENAERIQKDALSGTAKAVRQSLNDAKEGLSTRVIPRELLKTLSADDYSVYASNFEEAAALAKLRRHEDFIDASTFNPRNEDWRFNYKPTGSFSTVEAESDRTLRFLGVITEVNPDRKESKYRDATGYTGFGPGLSPIDLNALARVRLPNGRYVEREPPSSVTIMTEGFLSKRIPFGRNSAPFSPTEFGERFARHVQDIAGQKEQFIRDTIVLGPETKNMSQSSLEKLVCLWKRKLFRLISCHERS
jgi:hypothetical protein